MINLIIGQHKLHNIIFYAGVSLVLFLYSAQGAAEELGLDNFVHSILKNNPGVQKILADKDVAAGARDASLGIDDATLSSSLNLNVESEPSFFKTMPRITHVNLSSQLILPEIDLIIPCLP